MSLEGKVVLVTGAARGMGREYVRGFIAKGAKVVATDIAWSPTGVSSDEIDFRDELTGNPNALVEVMDVTIDSHVKRVFESTMRAFGTVDAVVNNAGLRQRDLYPPHGSVTLLETEVGDWQRMFDTQVFGVIRVIKAFSAPMLANRRGSIINIGSSAWGGQNPDTREMPYKSAKGTVGTLTFYLAHELKPQNIAVNLLLPGHTRSTGSDEQERERAEIRSKLRPEALPAMPLRMRPEHVVPLALFLADQDASGVTGQELSAVRWNEEQGLGAAEAWAYPPDVAARS
jgi:1,1a-dihydroxy-1-hydro-9-fluorenone dehydrogenase